MRSSRGSTVFEFRIAWHGHMAILQQHRGIFLHTACLLTSRTSTTKASSHLAVRAIWISRVDRIIMSPAGQPRGHTKLLLRGQYQHPQHDDMRHLLSAESISRQETRSRKVHHDPQTRSGSEDTVLEYIVGIFVRISTVYGWIDVDRSKQTQHST